MAAVQHRLDQRGQILVTADYADNNKGHRSVTDFGLVVRSGLQTGLGCWRVDRDQTPVLLVKRRGGLVGELCQLGDFGVAQGVGGVKIIRGGAAIDGAEYIGHEKS